MSAILSQISVYPIKSCGGIAVDSWIVDELGLTLDRRWMVIDESGRFQTQRWQQRLALVRPALTPDGVLLRADGMPELEAPPGGGAAVATAVWDEPVRTESCGAAADQWLSELLGASCRLVYLPDDTLRPMDGADGTTHGRVSLADAFPFLLVGEASLDDLNARLDAPVPMNRFRPNLVVRGTAPYEEDGWGRFAIGELDFAVTRPCVRCRIPTIDQDTAEAGKEPSRTLATYRKRPEGVIFGVNVAHAGTGRLDIGLAIRR